MASVNYQLLIWDGVKQKRVDSEVIELKLGKLALGVFTDVEAALSQEIADRQAAVSAEASARSAADSALDAALTQEIADRTQAVADEASSRQAADAALSTSLDAEASRALAAEQALDAKVDQEIADRAAGDASTLASAQAYADQKITDLVNAAPGTLDTLKEIADAIANDANIAATLTAAIAGVQAEVDAEEIRAAAAEAVLASDIAGHEARLDVMDIIDTTLQSTVFENNAGVYADARPGTQDAGHREGWYFKNAGPVNSAQNKFNWYFFDGVAENVTLGDFSGYAILTMDSLVSKPHMAIYTTPQASGNAASWYRSKKVFIIDPSASVVAGKKYLMYFGTDPKVHPELPRLPMVLAGSPSAPVGPLADNERILTAVIGSDSGTAIGNCETVVEALGVYSPSVKRKTSLKIRKASVAELLVASASATSAVSAEQTRALAAEATLQSNINSLTTVVNNLKFVDKTAAVAVVAGQICYVKPDGQVALAAAGVDLSDAQLMIAVASLASGASGKFVVVEGTVVGGYSGLTAGKKYFVSSTAGSIAASTAGFSAGHSVYSVGRAISATEIAFAPMYEFEY
jgi:hypothetical protein